MHNASNDIEKTANIFISNGNIIKSKLRLEKIEWIWNMGCDIWYNMGHENEEENEVIDIL